jgi:hypothetical protein
MLDPRSGLPSAWVFTSVRIDAGEIRAAYARPRDRLRAVVTLTHPDAAPPHAAARTARFAVGVAASARDPGVREGVRELVEAVVANVRALEQDFAWLALDDHGKPHGGVMSAAACAREIDHHLDLVPWIDLEVAFDHEACFREAAILGERFAAHQSGLESELAPGWKSLAVRARGGGLHHGSDYAYRVADGPAAESALTEIAALVPHTLALMDRLVTMDRVTSARFMVLEPGGAIPVHSDDLTHPVSHSLNIAFNMPEGCELWIDLDPDGAKGPFARLAPFKAGTALILNVAKHHAVHNRSAEPRIHLKVEGPWKLPLEQVLALARKQNGIDSPKELCARLVEKYRTLGRAIVPGTTLHEDATSLGVL